MEMHFSEMDDNTNPNNFFNANEMSKYWEQKTEVPKPPPKKKKVSFDDILSNMNIVVGQNGALQFMTPLPPQNEQNQYQNQYPQQNQYSQQNQYQNQYQNQNFKQPIKVQKTQEPLDLSVKHSYIYNKYFKDYQDANAPAPEVKVPKTMEEYRQMVLEERIKREQQIKRISEIKSKKLMFTANPNMQIGNPRNIQASKNNLRNMSFK